MRRIINFNDNWFFNKPDTYLTGINLPHTYNAVDGQDGNGTYYRGLGIYTKEFKLPTFNQDECVYLEVLAASQAARVYLNGEELTKHEGGYSIFRIELTKHLQANNKLVIEVDNSVSDHIYPQMADFTFYGGLYRGVNLIITNQVHFDLDYYGALGLKVDSKIQGSDALLKLDSYVNTKDDNYSIQYLVKNEFKEVVLEANRLASKPYVEVILSDVNLWQGIEDPYLYEVEANLIYRNQVVDCVSLKHGVREYYVDANEGFFLNGIKTPLRGVSRHQDKLGKGCALSIEDHIEDIELIYELGANNIRLAHYQHAQEFYDLCDEYGFVVWAEIPYISSQLDGELAHQNVISQMRELVLQNYHHASICFWGISNEITISGEKPGLVDNHRALNKMVKEMDPSRLTTIAHVSMLSTDSELHSVTDIESYNHYFGWYGGTLEQNEQWLDAYHAKYPTRCLGLSEYGAEGIITYQNSDPKVRDYSEAYQALYHEHLLKVISERDYLWSTQVWNMFDFGCAARDEGGVKGRNNKGLVSIDRKIKKDAFYLYKAYWSHDEFVHICNARYNLRATTTNSFKVYSNSDEVSLFVNGEFASYLKADKVFIFNDITLKPGFNTISARTSVEEVSISIEVVDSEPAIYTLVEEDDGIDTSKVANWFDEAQALVTSDDITVVDGYFSVKDTVNDLLDNKEASDFLVSTFATVSGMKMKAGMLRMLGGKRLDELMDLAGQMGKELPPHFLAMVNLKLNTIKK